MVIRHIVSSTAKPEEALRIIKDACDDPNLYPDKRDLLREILPLCGKALGQLEEDKNISLKKVVAGSVALVSYENVSKMLAANIFAFPTESITDPQTGAKTPVVRNDIRSAFYKAFGYFEVTPENIRHHIAQVFTEVAQGKYPNFSDFMEALLWAEGKFGISHGKKVNMRSLQTELGRTGTVHTLDDFSYQYLEDFVTRRHIPYTPEQAQIIFTKAGHRCYWTPEELKKNAKAEIAAMQCESQPPTFYQAVRRLLPKEAADGKQIAIRMKSTLPEGQDFSIPMTQQRLSSLMVGDTPFPEAEKNAILSVLEQLTGITPEDQIFLSGLENQRRITGSPDFSAKLLAMLKEYCYVDSNRRGMQGSLNLMGSCEQFAELTRPDPNSKPLLTRFGVNGAINRPARNVFQTIRAITLGFENRKKQYEEQQDSDLAAQIESDLDILISYTPFKRETFFLDANASVEHFIKESPEIWPSDAPFTRIGSLLNEIRRAWNFDISIENLYQNVSESEKGQVSFRAFQGYLTNRKEIIPIVDGNDADGPPATPGHKLECIISAIQKSLKQYNQPPLTNENVEAIRHVALQSYREFRVSPPETHTSRQRAASRLQASRLQNGTQGSITGNGR